MLLMTPACEGKGVVSTTQGRPMGSSQAHHVLDRSVPLRQQSRGLEGFGEISRIESAVITKIVSLQLLYSLMAEMRM